MSEAIIRLNYALGGRYHIESELGEGEMAANAGNHGNVVKKPN